MQPVHHSTGNAIELKASDKKQLQLQNKRFTKHAGFFLQLLCAVIIANKLGNERCFIGLTWSLYS